MLHEEVAVSGYKDRVEMAGSRARPAEAHEYRAWVCRARRSGVGRRGPVREKEGGRLAGWGRRGAGAG